MKDAAVLIQKGTSPITIQVQDVQWLIVGGGQEAFEALKLLFRYNKHAQVKLVNEEIDDPVKRFSERHTSVLWQEKRYDHNDLGSFAMIIVATGNKVLNEKIHAEAKQQNALVYLPSHPQLSDYIISVQEE